MRKMAAIDVGTNSVLYSIFKIGGRSGIEEVHFERHTPRIGERLKDSTRPRITRQNYVRLRNILKKNLRHAAGEGVGRVRIAATNPLRLAENGEKIRGELEADLQHDVEVLSSRREAELSFLGAVGELRKNQKAGLIDLGGGSTEFMFKCGPSIEKFISLPDGAVSLTELFNSQGKVAFDKFSDYNRVLKRYDKKLRPLQAYKNYRMVLVGGTSSILAYLKDSSILALDKSVTLTVSELQLFIDILARMNATGRRQLLDIDKKRADLIFAGAFWLHYLFNMLDLGKAEATRRGLRHGLIMELNS